MNRTKFRRGQPNTALTVHGSFTIHGPWCWYANIAKWKNVLNMGYTNPKSFSKLVHLFWTSVPPSGDCSNQLSAWWCALTTNFGEVPRGGARGEGPEGRGPRGGARGAAPSCVHIMQTIATPIYQHYIIIIVIHVFVQTKKHKRTATDHLYINSLHIHRNHKPYLVTLLVKI